MYNIDDPSLATVLRGQSVIDYPALHLKTRSEAISFLQAYGYDPKGDRQLLESLYQESLVLLAEFLADGEAAIPKRFLATVDFATLLVWSSTSFHSARSLWACSILRIAHTLSHCHSYFNDHYHRQIRNQIVGNFDRFLVRSADKVQFGPFELFDFQIRPLKTRRSVAIKLLHKSENVAADIFDWIGVRFITHDRYDAFCLLNYLKDRNILMFANIKPSRSRNTLFDPDWLASQANQMRQRTFSDLLNASPYPAIDSESKENRHSHAHYHSIQFTCRQRIKIHELSFGDSSFFFPFEVQIMDVAAYRQSRMGEASHKRYKERQFTTAAKRVLGPLYNKYGRKTNIPTGN